MPKYESQEQMRTFTLSITDCDWGLLVIRGLLKAFSDICVKANSVCCYGLSLLRKVLALPQHIGIQLS